MKTYFNQLAALLTLAITATVSAPTLAWADPDQEVLRVTSDSQDSIGLLYRLEVSLDGGKATQLVYHSFAESTKKPVKLTYTVAQVQRGIVLVPKAQYEVVKLLAPKFNPQTGGAVIMDYLINGLTSKRGQMHLWFAPNAAGEWALLHNGKPISEIMFKTNRVMGKEAGVKQIVIVR